MDAIRTLKALLRDEIGHDRPNFEVIQSYLKALKEVLGRAHKLSVVDVGRSQISLTAGSLMVQDEDGDGESYGHMMKSKGRGNSWEDQMLVTLAQVAQRSGPDPLMALLQSLPNVETLYPEPEREAIREYLRAEVNRRIKKDKPEETPSAKEAA